MTMAAGPTSILMRADAGAAIGIGHAMRCLALAQVWRERSARVVFATREGSPGVEAKMRAEGVDVARVAAAGGNEDLSATLQIAREMGAEWTVMSGVPMSPAAVDAFHASGSSVLVIDDDGTGAAARPDVMVNQNHHATGALYAECTGATRLLLGPSYALLRREFREWSGWHRAFEGVGRNVLVTLGGSDPDNATGRLLAALEGVDIEPLDVTVVVGASNVHGKAVEAQVAKNRARVRVERDTTRMAELMAWADVAVSSGGSTVWELAFMGLPSLVGSIVDDQRALVGSIPFFESLGAFASVSSDSLASALRLLLLDRERRMDQSKRARAVVDGRGCERVLGALCVNDRRVRGRRPRAEAPVDPCEAIHERE